jgi:hypothetical protein
MEVELIIARFTRPRTDAATILRIAAPPLLTTAQGKRLIRSSGQTDRGPHAFPQEHGAILFEMRSAASR